jgi:hypothetical protein
MRRLLALATVLVSFAARGDDSFIDAIQTSQLSGFGKLMYVADDKKGGRLNQGTPGFGGRLGVKTGDYHGLSFKGAVYTTQDLGLRSDNPRETDAYMFDLDKTPYSLLGEAQLGFAADKTTLTIGRQEFFSPIINSYEYRIIPNLFEAWTLTNRSIPNTTLTLAHVGKMSGFDGLVTYSEFRSMSQQTYTSLIVNAAGQLDTSGETIDPSRVVGHNGVWVAGVEIEKNHRLRLWNFHGTDTLNTTYVDGRLKHELNDRIATTLEAQAYRVTAVGRFKEYLAQRGLDASYSLGGIKGTLAYKPAGLSLSLAHNRFGGSERTVTAFGNWGGYPEFVSMPYLFAEKNGASAIARSRLSKFTAVIDLGVYGLNEHGLILGHARIDTDQRILPNTDILVNSMIYRAKLDSKWSLRAAAEWRSSINSRYDNEFIALSVRYDF